MNSNIFDNLFVLEAASNHLGDLDRGLKIIRDFARVVRFNNVRAGIKLQFRDVDNFIHKDFIGSDERYIKKTLITKMPNENYSTLVKAIKGYNCIPMATPFDERSVELCSILDIEIIKIASSDVNDWFLIEKIGETKKPVIVSTGGTSIKDLDDLVLYFEHRNIPLAINHCLSLYPCNAEDLNLKQIDFLKNRYPNHTIGLSTHEKGDHLNSIMIAYAKGARTFERHIDIESDKRSPYCSTPEQIDKWFKQFKLAQEICGDVIRNQPETDYLNKLVRGMYAKRNLLKGEILSRDRLDKDFYLAIPWQEGQISCRGSIDNEVLNKDILQDKSIMEDDIV